MVRQGYAATTVDDIAVESGVSRKALYAHFSGKEDVLLQAHRAVGERIMAGAGPIIAEQTDWKSALRAFLDWTLEFFSREPAFAHLVLVEMAAATPTSRRVQRASLTPVRDLIQRGADEGDTSLSEVALDGLLGGVVYVIANANDAGTADLRALAPELMEWIVVAVESRQAARQEQPETAL
jgi:AcrR family transcriptional regulator